jgi:citrate lyase subunit gamma (acyl carrier protein)
MKIGMAGSLESCDCRATVQHASVESIEIQSAVGAFFHDQILEAVHQALRQAKNGPYAVKLEDKGAYDYAITARVLAAIARLEE